MNVATPPDRVLPRDAGTPQRYPGIPDPRGDLPDRPAKVERDVSSNYRHKYLTI